MTGSQISAIIDAMIELQRFSGTTHCLQTEETITQRLNARWAVEQSTADAATAKVAHQGLRKAQQLAKVAMNPQCQ